MTANNKDFIDGDFHAHAVEPLLRSRRAAAGQMALLDGFNLSVFDALADVHRRLRAPVQMIWGTDDPWFPLGPARQMVEQFAGGCDLQLLERGKLFAHEEFPEAFGTHARRFLVQAFEGPHALD